MSDAISYDINAGTMLPATSPPCCIAEPYLLALDTAVFQDAEGRYWASSSWAHDLIAHMRYISDLTMFGVIIKANTPPDDAVRLPDLGIRYVASRYSYGRKYFYLGLPRLVMRLVCEIWKARVVHSTIAYGEGFPLGWIAFPVARLLRRKTIVIVEGSMWRLSPGERAGPKRRFEAWISEIMNRWCLRQVDYAAYQHAQYQSSLPSPRARGGALFQASWISREDVADAAVIDERYRARDRRDYVPRAVFATRLIKEKGTRVLATAIDLLAASGIDLDLDIIGDGEDRDLLAAYAGRELGKGRVSMLPAIPYGPAFFRFLADYDLLVSPGLADEQPRIVYDAGAQGVGAVVSDTPGLLSCVIAGETAMVVKRGDGASLASAIIALVGAPHRFRAMGLASRAFAECHTHERMHRDRCRGIRHMLDHP